MSGDTPDRAERAFANHDAFERDGDAFERDGDAFVVTTTRFGGRVTVADTDDWALAYTLTVRTPMLHAAADDDVGDAVEAGWFETFERRLGDAAMATRADLDLDEVTLREEADEAVATFAFEYGNTDHAPDVVKAIAEYVEGTYVEGVVPGYDYQGVVADLLGEAQSSDNGGAERGGTPL